MLNKKTISPVVATALLLVVGVTAVIGFQNFFGSFSSGLFSNVEEKKVFENQIKFEFLSTQSAYIKSTLNEGLISFKISDSTNNVLCEVKDNYDGNLRGDTKMIYTFDSQTYNLTHLHDLSGYNNTAVVSGATYTNIDCVSEGCFVFDGINDTIFVLNSNYNEEKGTISMWFKLNEIQSRVLFQQYNNDVNRFQFYLTGLNLSLFGGHSSTSLFWLTSSNFANNTEWKHGVVTYDYTLDNFKIYLDGILIANTNANMTKSTDDGRITFGASMDYDDAPTYYSNYFNGSIDEVAIYSKVLTENEVLALYNLEKAKFYEEILPIGVKEINISNCNLTRGEKYNLVAFTNNQKIEQSLIAK